MTGGRDIIGSAGIGQHTGAFGVDNHPVAGGSVGCVPCDGWCSVRATGGIGDAKGAGGLIIHIKAIRAVGGNLAVTKIIECSHAGIVGGVITETTVAKTQVSGGSRGDIGFTAGVFIIHDDQIAVGIGGFLPDDGAGGHG